MLGLVFKDQDLDWTPGNSNKGILSLKKVTDAIHGLASSKNINNSAPGTFGLSGSQAAKTANNSNVNSAKKDNTLSSSIDSFTQKSKGKVLPNSIKDLQNMNISGDMLEDIANKNNAINIAMNRENNQFNADQAQLQRDYETMMSNTAHQREVADLQAAGLNPVLSAGGMGASTPTGSNASSSNFAGVDESIINALASITGAALSANASMTAAQTAANASMYSADKGLQGSQAMAGATTAAASMQAGATMYAADQNYASSIYKTDKNYAATMAGVPAKYMQAVATAIPF